MNEFLLDDSSLEQVSCLCCRSESYTAADVIQWKSVSLEYAWCNDCGLKYMRSRPSQEWMKAFYKAAFWQEKLENTGYLEVNAGNEQVEQAVGLKTKTRNQQRRARRIGTILQESRVLDRGTSVLEIGASFGETLHHLKSVYGCTVAAVEPNEVACGILRGKGIQVLASYYEEFDRESHKHAYDIVIFSHVLENTSDPVANLSLLHEILKPGGHVYIDTPNMYYSNDVNPYHMLVFTPETLTNSLRKAGFEPIHERHEPHPSQLKGNPLRLYDPYLSMVSKRGTSHTTMIPFDLDRVQASQARGNELYQAGQRQVRRRFSQRVKRKLLNWMRMPPTPVIGQATSCEEATG